MKMSKVGNQTNSQDPQAVNSRVFVGNLNTFQCSKTDVERMFQRYGRLAGISMHKGYAFVQFTNPFDARSACLGEDGRTVLSQVLDVNMVAEPKPHQTGRKRQNVAKTGNDWDYYYDSYYASTSFPVGPPRLVPPLKRPRLMTNSGRNGKATTPQKNTTTTTACIEQLKTYSNPDILICGNCREMFTDLQELLDHKKTYCKLRFTCKCHQLNGLTDFRPGGDEDQTAAALLCVQCKDSFGSAWDLMVHAQAAHMLNIYELGVPNNHVDQGQQTSQDDDSPCQTPDNSRPNSPEQINTDYPSELGKDLAESEIKHQLDNTNEEITNNIQTGSLIPLTVKELKDIKNFTSGRRLKEFYSRQLVKCDLTYIAKLLLLLGKISIGSFLISFCILSLILLSHISWNYFDNNGTKCLQDSLPHHYTVLNNNNTWYNTYYPSVFEEDMLLKHCTNKFKHGFLRGKGKCRRFGERRMKHFLRPFIVERFCRKKTNNKTKEQPMGPVTESEYYEKIIEDMEEKYNNLKDEYYDQQLQFKSLKNQCELKNNMNKHCIKLMLKEIISLNRELKCRNELDINKKDQKKLDKISVAHLDSNLWYLMNPDIIDKNKYERIGRVKLHNALNIDPFDVNISKSEQERSVELMEKKVKEMADENIEIANAIKDKQKELFHLTHDITSSIRFLEYKKMVLHFFENRLAILKGITSKPTNVTQSSNETSLAPINIPLNLIDSKNQKSMGEAMLDEIINSTVSKTEDKNVCVCELEEDGFSEESVSETLELEKKRIELDNLISNRLTKLQTKSSDPFKKLLYIAKWDDKNLWISRKLNDKEHARVLHMYPKCNPARAWIRNRRFTH